MKRIFTLLLSLFISVQILASDYDFWIGNFYYKITSESERTVELVKNPDGCFYSSGGYSGRIVIPDSVEYNGRYYKVTSFGSDVFVNSNISITFPNTLRIIKEMCFRTANLQSEIYLPSSLDTIEQFSFYCNGIEKIYIPASVKYVATGTFASTSLDSIIVDTSNQHYKSIDGVLYNKDATEIICFPLARDGNFVVPNGVTHIKSRAFWGNNLSSITLPNSLKSIEQYAFLICNKLQNLCIPQFVNHIEGGAIIKCDLLQGLAVDSLNTYYKVINDAIYSHNGDTLITFPGPKSVWPELHEADTFRIAEGTKIIAKYAVSHTVYNKVIILPESVVEIKERAFSGSDIRIVCFPKTLKIIGENAFNSCNSLNYFMGGDSLEIIKSGAFAYCSNFRKNIVFPSTLKVLGGSAFYGTPINEVEFTGEVDTLMYPFYGTVKKMTLVNKTPPYFENVDEGMIICRYNNIIIPCNSTQAYLSDPNWSSYNYTEDCDGIEDIDPQSAVQVVAQHKAVDVYNAENYSVAIYDLMGRCHTAEPATGYNLRHYTLPNSGVYIVRVNGKGYKVVVQ